MLDAQPEGTQVKTLIDLMVSEAIKSSEIEDEYLSREDVQSSIQRNLGRTELPPTRNDAAAGIGELMLASATLRSPSTGTGNLPTGERRCTCVPCSGASGPTSRNANGVAFSYTAVSAFCI